MNYESDLIEFFVKQAATLWRPQYVSPLLWHEFNKTYNQDESVDVFYKRTKGMLSNMHKFQLNILDKVAIIFIFGDSVSNEVKQELDHYPEYTYMLSDKNEFVEFTSDLLIIKKYRGIATKSFKETDSVGAPPLKRKRTSESISTASDVEEIGGEDSEEGFANEQKVCEIGRNHKEKENQRQNGVENYVEPNMERGLESCRGVVQKRRGSIQKMGPYTLEEDVFHAPNVEVPAPTICAYRLAYGIAGMCYTFKANDWYIQSTRMVEKLAGKNQRVPLKDFSFVLRNILKKFQIGLATRYDVRSIHVREFLVALQTSVVFPLGEMITEILREIDSKIEMYNERENQIAKDGSVEETWRMSMDVVHWCIETLLRLVPS